MSTTPPPLACVLAGGRSTRMGRDKAMLPWHGRPLIEHAIACLRQLRCEVVVAGSRPDLADYAPVLPDLHPDAGPLAGIEAALSFAAQSGPAALAAPVAIPEQAPAVLFLPVDLPFLPVSVLALLLRRSHSTGSAATIPTLGGRPQPLCAVYRSSLLPGITAALDQQDGKVMRAVANALHSLSSRDRADLFSLEALVAAGALRPAPSDAPGQPARLPQHWFANMNTPEQAQALDRI
ncbi:MAG TPA: molybdenum cofactor guanylyltransferase [Acidobacteriaceae bacterium]